MLLKEDVRGVAQRLRKSLRIFRMNCCPRRLGGLLQCEGTGNGLGPEIKCNTHYCLFQSYHKNKFIIFISLKTDNDWCSHFSYLRTSREWFQFCKIYPCQMIPNKRCNLSPSLIYMTSRENVNFVSFMNFGISESQSERKSERMHKAFPSIFRQFL